MASVIDGFGGNLADLADNLAFAAINASNADLSEVDPAKYKDLLEAPTKFNEACDHPDPFQRESWRAAIAKSSRR